MIMLFYSYKFMEFPIYLIPSLQGLHEFPNLFDKIWDNIYTRKRVIR